MRVKLNDEGRLEAAGTSIVLTSQVGALVAWGEETWPKGKGWEASPIFLSKLTFLKRK